MTEIMFLIEEDEVDGGFVASAIGQGITTQADTIPDLREMIRDALHCHFDNEADIPQIINLHFVRNEIMTYAQ